MMTRIHTGTPPWPRRHRLDSQEFLNQCFGGIEPPSPDLALDKVV
jgi:hypothetical protein